MMLGHRLLPFLALSIHTRRFSTTADIYALVYQIYQTLLAIGNLARGLPGLPSSLAPENWWSNLLNCIIK